MRLARIEIIAVAVGLLVIACDEKREETTGTVEGGTDATATGGSTTDATTDATSGSATAAVTTDATTGAGGPCGAEARCLSAVPEDWTGPVAMLRGPAEGFEPPECSAGYPSKGLTLLEGYTDPGPASCDCECGVNLSALCNANVYDYAAGCTTFLEVIPLSQDCLATDLTGGGYFTMFQSGQPTCSANKIVDLPEAGWDGMMASCAGAEQADECDGGVCTPAAPEGYDQTLCIFAQGEFECPPGDFSEKSTFLSGANDTRNCSSCICGPGTATCTGSLDVFDSNDCSGDSIANLGVNVTCDEAAAGGQSVAIAFDDDGSCPVEIMPEPTGTIEPAEAFTYCCEPA